MANPKLPESKKSKTARASQDFLTIDSIRDGVIVLKDGGFRMILMASAFNFALKSPEEQDAIIYQYQNFLNSVDFPVQFVVQSRKLNIEPYLAGLREFERAQENELLKMQTGEYIEFVRNFVELSNIVTKTFYIVVPFSPSIAESLGAVSFLGSFLKPKTKRSSEALKDDSFMEYKTQLLQRVDSVQLGLQRFGIRTIILKTDELIELFYSLYNPQELEKEKSANRGLNL
ncbi:MAG: hypothetical protein HYT39_01160 [Candidatus Sungbacteria bacterium]|nr:hypothetical protein [Candidatus Sungbacteria bacterium]